MYYDEAVLELRVSWATGGPSLVASRPGWRGRRWLEWGPMGLQMLHSESADLGRILGMEDLNAKDWRVDEGQPADTEDEGWVVLS